MKLIRDIQSLSTFKRDTAKSVRQMKKTSVCLVRRSKPNSARCLVSGVITAWKKKAVGSAQERELFQLE